MRETQIDISSQDLAYNLTVFKNKIQPNTKILANLKANAYGIGAVPVGKFLEKQGIDYFSIAYINEGIYLRKQGIKAKLLVFNPSFEHFKPLVTYQLEPEVSSLAYLQKLITYLNQQQITGFPVHIKLDTGMHRAGIMPEELPNLIALLQTQKTVKIASVFSHLAAAEDPDSDDFTRHQIALFKNMTEYISTHYSGNFLKHLLNTAGVFRFPQAQFDMIRPGLGLLGYTLIEKDRHTLKPVFQLTTKINQVKHISKGESVGYNRNFTATQNTTIALLPVGYADGINRQLTGFSVHCKGQKVPIIGTISMDTMSLDITGTACRAGDKVILINNHDSVYQIAKHLQTIPYEIIASLSHRIPRNLI